MNGTAKSPPWLGDALAVLAIVLLALLPRLLALGADPPPDFQFGFLPDEGAWAHNARQHVLFGQWIMDQHNPGLYAAPLYTLALDFLYRIVGIGLVQTRLLSALSGFLCCLLWYTALRGRLPVRQALPPALVLALSYFMLTNNRVAFTESFQLLWVSATVAALFHAWRRPAWAIVAGASVVLALLVKPSAGLIGLVLVVFWAVHWQLSRRKQFTPAFSFRQPLLFAGAAAALALIILLLVIVPNWASVSQQLGVSLRNVYGEGAHLDEGRTALFGWSALGFSMNLFFLQCAVLLLAVVIFAVARLGRAVDPPVNIVELFCWIWLVVGLLFLANQRYQPDRRFLLLMPPIGYLVCAAVQLGGLRFPGRSALVAPGQWWRAVSIGALLGGFLGFYGQYVLRGRLLHTFPGLFHTPANAGAALWALAILGGVALALMLSRLLPERALKVPALLLVALFLVADPVRFAVYLSRPRFTIPRANRELAELTRTWSRQDKVIVGTSADVFALGTDLFSFPIRIRDWTQSYMNLDGWERFKPSLAVVIAPIGKLPDDVEQQKVLEGAVSRGFVAFARYPTRVDRHGHATWEATVYGRPDLVEGGSKTRP